MSYSYVPSTRYKSLNILEWQVKQFFFKESYFYLFQIILQIGDECGDAVCKFGGECCMECGRNGELVPSGKCADPGLPCPFVHCEVPVTVEPPIIIDPPGENMNRTVALYKSF